MIPKRKYKVLPFNKLIKKAGKNKLKIKKVNLSKVTKIFKTIFFSPLRRYPYSKMNKNVDIDIKTKDKLRVKATS